jgi:hypothetical protein
MDGRLVIHKSESQPALASVRAVLLIQEKQDMTNPGNTPERADTFTAFSEHYEAYRKRQQEC